jgi:hypothetical protein
MKRTPTSKRLRFNIFERDNFTCQYCGKRPPEVVLEIDHIIPVSKGGETEHENLLTACFECNRGKSAFEIGKFPERVGKNVEEIEERYEQLKALYQFQKNIKVLKEQMVEDVIAYAEDVFGEFAEQKERATIKMFLSQFSAGEIEDAIDIAYAKTGNFYHGWRYFCGIMHTKRKNRDARNATLTSTTNDSQIEE